VDGVGNIAATNFSKLHWPECTRYLALVGGIIMAQSHEVNRGVELLLDHLEKLIDENSELSDIHDAFERFCMTKYAIGDGTTSTLTAGKYDCGIDFFSFSNATYHIGQCKIPERNWLEAHPEKIRGFGSQAVSDCRDALNFLIGESKIKANDQVRYLLGQIESDKNRDDFGIVFFLLVFGRLNERAQADFAELKQSFLNRNVRLVLQQIDEIVDDFLVGSGHAADKVEIKLRKDKGTKDRESSLNAHDYCYFLGNAADIFTAFKDFGWRLFDLNLRYEIRNSSVNGNIVDSLQHSRTRKNFHHYNNGLIILCQQYTVRDDHVRITNAQVVNGLQTVKSIYNAVTAKDVELSDLERDCRVQVKVIRNDKPDFIADVVQATNNQNPMAPRNLRSNSREQKLLRREFASLTPRWFFQVKQGEWDSLTQEGGRFFKDVVGHPPSEFKPEPNRKRGRVIDNQEAAKAWLAFIGFSDWAGDRTTHYFGKKEVYEIAFRSSPTSDHWKHFAELTHFQDHRHKFLTMSQATGSQYLLSYLAWEFTRQFIPSPAIYREQGLMEGVRQGKIKKEGGSFTSSIMEQDKYLADNHTYQTWRLMANMKEVLVEAIAFILVKKYGALNDNVSYHLLSDFDARHFLESGDIKQTATTAALGNELPVEALFSRILAFLRFAAGQYWEAKQNQILSTSRVRTLLIRPDMIADFKEKLIAVNQRVALDEPWKPRGKTFIESLPILSQNLN
jgi:hypothetical protein